MQMTAEALQKEIAEILGDGFPARDAHAEALTAILTMPGDYDAKRTNFRIEVYMLRHIGWIDDAQQASLFALAYSSEMV